MPSSNKTALITAAGSGMGAAIASRLAADGYQVAVMSSSGNLVAVRREPRCDSRAHAGAGGGDEGGFSRLSHIRLQ